MFKDTEQLSGYVDKLLGDIEQGSITNAGARVRLMAAKLKLDVVKVEMQAASLGRDFGPVAFSSAGRIKEPAVRRVS